MDRNPVFQDSSWLIMKIQLKLQLSCRAARASLSAISAAAEDHDYVVYFERKSGKNIPTESTESDSGEHAGQTKEEEM